MFKIINPKTKTQIEEYYKLRWLTLRKDWNQEIGSEKDIYDKDSIHRMVIDKNGLVLAVGRLHYNSIIESQIRFMGVHPSYRRINLGTIILQELEKISKETNHYKIILQARESAVKFYSSNGYVLEKKTHLLFDNIQHFLMSKRMVAI